MRWLASHRRQWETTITNILRHGNSLPFAAPFSTHTAFTNLPIIDIAALRDPDAVGSRITGHLYHLYVGHSYVVDMANV